MSARPMTKKEWLAYLQKAIDEFDWNAAFDGEPKREWVGLTDELKVILIRNAPNWTVIQLIEETELLLKEKNK